MSRVLRLSQLIARYRLFREEDEETIEDLYWLLWRRRVRLTSGVWGYPVAQVDRVMRLLRTGEWFGEE